MTGPAQTEERLSEVRFLTVAEVAALMRVSKMTVYRLVHGGDLTAVRVYLPYGAQWYGYLMRRIAARPSNVAFIGRGRGSRT